MGKVIKKKLNGMSWSMKSSLILILTLASTLFMYQGWYHPSVAKAAGTVVTYYITGDTTTSLGADGTANLPTSLSTTTATSTTTPTFKGKLSTTAGTSISWQPSSTSTGNIVMLNAYTPVYASNTAISSITANIAVQSASAAHKWSMNLYDYNPAGALNNKTLIATSSTPNVSATGTPQGLSLTFTMSGTPVVLAGHRLMVQIVHIATVSSTTERIYYTGNTATTGTYITLTESLDNSHIVTCGGCHGYKTTFNDGVGRNNPVGEFPGTHKAHVITNAMTCDQCHVAPATESYADFAHANGTIQVLGTLGFSANKCSSTSCHGTGGSPTWGTNSAANIDTCTKCHGTPSVSPATPLQIMPTVPATFAHAAHMSSTTSRPVSVCTECHQNVVATNSAGHMDGTKTLQFNGPIGDGVDYPMSPTSCATSWCHGGTNTTAIPLNAARVTPTWGTTFGAIGTIGTNTGVAGGSGTANTGTGRCAACHGFPPATDNHIGATLNGATKCLSCHDNIRTDGTFIDPTLHINGIIEGGTCTSCHAQTQPASSPKRIAAAAQFSQQSHHAQGAEVVDNSVCYKCHMEASDTSGKPDANYHNTSATVKAVNLVTWSNGQTGTGTRGTTFVSYTANGSRAQIAKVNNHCLSCHNTSNAAFTPFGTYRTDQFSPEARLASPKAKTSIQSRYSSTRTVAWSQSKYSSATGNISRFGTNNKYQITKALSAHGNAIKNQFPQWDSTANGKGEDGFIAKDVASATLSSKRNVFCYDCHNSHGSAAAGITSSYSSATGRYKGGLLKTTTSGLGGYTATYTPAARSFTYRNFSSVAQSTATTTTATVNTGASICNDCHNNDTRKVNIAKPWSITDTYSSAKAIVGYWSTPYFDNYTVTSTKRSVYKAGGAAAASNNRQKPMGGHFGSSVGGAGRSAAHAGDINGLCTPCHDPHGVSNALGVDRDHGVPLLKGTWVTSPYREDKADKAVQRGGGSKFAGVTGGGAIPGYHIDQNTFMVAPAPASGGATTSATKGNMRNQRFRSFSILSSAQTGVNYPNNPATVFGGLCLECHNQQSLTGSATATTSAAWKSKARIHQSVNGWASTNGTNVSNKVHAYTCAKCHAPHVSRLPRLLVTNCLDPRHFGQSVSTSIASTGAGTTTPGNFIQSTLTSSALGAGRFPGGGSRYSGTITTAKSAGGWWFQTNGTSNAQPTAARYGSDCHNTATAGGATYSPVNQKWNNKSVW